MKYELHQDVPIAPYPNFHFLDSRGDYVFVSGSKDFHDCSGAESGTYIATCYIPANLLNSTTYFIGLALTFTHQGIHVSFFEKDALCLTVVDPIDKTIDDLRFGYAGPMPGVVRPKLEWQIGREL